MPTLDLQTLTSAGGWAIAVAVTLGLLGLFARDKLHSDGEMTRERQARVEVRAERDAALDLLKQNAASLDTLVRSIPELIRAARNHR